MPKVDHFIVPTANRPYLAVDGLRGLGFKSMNTLDEPRIWSVVIRIEAGKIMPKRHNSGLCEILVVRGKGRYASGAAFNGGDYLRETSGEYEAIEALEELVFFVTHHGDCTFLAENGAEIFVATNETIGNMLPNVED